MSTVDDLPEKLEFLQGTLEVLILRSLARGPNHAYGIAQFLAHESGREFVVDNGSLYPALQRLLRRRWIAAQWKTSPNGRRARYYRLTPAGRKQSAAATSQWQRFVEAMARVLAPAAVNE
jgi:transcriptional regulator